MGGKKETKKDERKSESQKAESGENASFHLLHFDEVMMMQLFKLEL